jgi:sulfate permease, SulP family
MLDSSLFQSYKKEFSGYSWGKFRQDLLAGLTVSAVALPLALAFGIASGATAAVGLVTSIIASVAMGLLAGAPYQLSGPTGGLVGILFMVAQRSGIQGIWLAGFLAGILLVVLGLLKLGRLVSYIPAPVITGFTSSVSLIVIIGQVDNFLGIKTPGVNSSLGKLLGYFNGGFVIDWHAVVIGLLVIAIVSFWPKSWDKRFPASLAGLVIATGFSMAVRWPVGQIGAIPQTLLLPERLTLSMILRGDFTNILAPAFSIAMLCAMESLLCGTVMGNVSGIRIRADQELISQGVGNIVLPFFGGMPATATMIRSSVMLKSGGQTRVAGLVKGASLLLTMFVLAPVMSRVPMAALAGVLMVIGWRMNRWSSIRSYFSHRFKQAILVYLVTVAVTIASDLVMGLTAGIIVSILVFLRKSARLEVEMMNPERLNGQGDLTDAGVNGLTRVASVSGQLFFATANQLKDALGNLGNARTLILSMRGVSMIDASGIDVLRELADKMKERGGRLLFTQVDKEVMQGMMDGGLMDAVSVDNIFQSTGQAMAEACRQPGGIE